MPPKKCFWYFPSGTFLFVRCTSPHSFLKNRKLLPEFNFVKDNIPWCVLVAYLVYHQIVPFLAEYCASGSTTLPPCLRISHTPEKDPDYITGLYFYTGKWYSLCIIPQLSKAEFSRQKFLYQLYNFFPNHLAFSPKVLHYKHVTSGISRYNHVLHTVVGHDAPVHFF